MDKTMFKGYVRELVREAVEEEVKRILPKMLDEAVNQVRSIHESAPAASTQKTKLDRSKLAQMMGFEPLSGKDTIVASTKNLMPELPSNISPDNPAVKAITKDYSAVMKAMGLTK
jgi:hypothetical protein